MRAVVVLGSNGHQNARRFPRFHDCHHLVGLGSLLVAPGEGAIVAAPDGARLPMRDGSEWSTNRADQHFLRISLTQTRTSEIMRTPRRLAQQQELLRSCRRATRRHETAWRKLFSSGLLSPVRPGGRRTRTGFTRNHLA